MLGELKLTFCQVDLRIFVHLNRGIYILQSGKRFVMQSDFWNIVGSISQIIGSVVAIIGIIYIAFQVRDTRRFTRSALLNELEKESRDHRRAFQLVTGEWKSDKEITTREDDVYELFECLGLFERIKLLLDNDVIDMRTVNELFGYRFFLIANNLNVQKHILYPDMNSFIAIFALHNQWRKYREEHDEPIAHDGTDLAKFNKKQYQEAFDTYRKRR